MNVWEWIKGRLGTSGRKRQRLRWRDKAGGKRKQEAAWRSGSLLPAHPGCLSSHPVSPFSPKAAQSSQSKGKCQPHIHFLSSSLSLSLSPPHAPTCHQLFPLGESHCPAAVKTLKHPHGEVHLGRNWGLLPTASTGLPAMRMSHLGGRPSSPRQTCR